jgi:hypothetical protein
MRTDLCQNLDFDCLWIRWQWRRITYDGSAMIKFEFEADISKDRSVKVEFARPLSEGEPKIMEVHGFRLSGTAGAWTHQSSGPGWGVEDLWELVNEFAQTQAG